METVDAPDREHVRGIATADVDDVLLEHETLEIVDGPREQPQVAGLGSA